MMLNLTPNSENNLVIYANTVSQSVGNFFLVVFTNSYSRETFAVVPNIVRRNSRFVELSVDLVGVDGQNLPLDGQIYLYPEGNFEYLVFNLNAPTTDPSTALPCMVWDTDEDFWEFARTVWDVCGLVDAVEIDRGQAFLYAEVPCEREVQFVPYVSDNEFLRNIVYVTGVSLYQFPCTIQANTTFTVENNTTTYCPIITIENNATLIINQGITLQQQFSPYEQC
jgi:hypothetical protein